MKKMINIAEILKDCPKGMELDCTLFQDTPVYFDSVTTDTNYPIEIKVEYPSKELETFFLNKYGVIYDRPTAKCVIFPKGKTTWEGFQRPFKDGDIVVGNNNCCSYVTIYKDYRDKNSFYYYISLNSFGKIKFNDYADKSNLRLATEEEKQKLFDAIKANCYKWNAETKTLEKLIKPKFKVGDRVKDNINNSIGEIEDINDEYYICLFNYGRFRVFISMQDKFELVPNKFDISTLKPFESRVLVRDYDNQIWIPTFWGRYLEDSSNCNYLTTNGCYKYCIPYEGNEHLLGTTNDCDEYYKTWE